MRFAKRFWLAVILAGLLGVPAGLMASPIQPTARELVKELQRPQVRFVPARVGWNPAQRPAADFNLTYEQYGPQATARAVRASLLAALTPDPVALAALLFCAFALRWIRIRKHPDVAQTKQAPPAPEVMLPRAA